MIALGIEFLAGRFHATPWDRAVNEGDVEWPPAPWRLLRAIVAGWHRAGGSDAATLRTVVDRLAAAPRYLLPPTASSHTRHFMPQGVIKKATLARSLVLDAFVAFSANHATAYAIWDDVELGHAEMELLRNACAHVTYLGRAESWCTVTVMDSLPNDPDLLHADLASRLEAAPQVGRRLGQPMRRLGPAADVRGGGLLRALALETDVMRQSGRLVPKGAVWFDYRVESPDPDFDVQHVRSQMPPRIERFALDAPTPAMRPLITNTIVIAELMRAAAMKQYSRLYDQESAPRVLSGKDADGRPATKHRHAYFLPLDRDDDGKIDHIDVYLPATSCHRVHRALVAVDRLWARSLGLPLDQQFLVTHLGQVERDQSQIWTSATPFVLERHVHTKTINGLRTLRDAPEEQIRRSLEQHGFSSDVTVQVSDLPLEHRRGNRTRLDLFRRTRKGDPPQQPFAARLEFAREQQGPIAIGRYAHFGLGQFVPAEV